MLKKTFIALAALGVAGAATAWQPAPAEAFSSCKDARYAHSDWCVRKAERKARWAAFWGGLFDRRDRTFVKGYTRRDVVVSKPRHKWSLFDRRKDRTFVKGYTRRDVVVAKPRHKWSLFDRRDRTAVKGYTRRDVVVAKPRHDWGLFGMRKDRKRF